MRAQPLCHTMLVSEITPTVDVDACMRVLHKSQWGIPAERIYLHKLWFVSYACDILWYIVLLLCNPRYSGEYKLNYISLFNFPILRRIWSYITEAVPSAASSKGDMWLWLLGHPLPCATKYSSIYLSHGYNHVLLHTLPVYLFSTSYWCRSYKPLTGLSFQSV